MIINFEFKNHRSYRNDSFFTMQRSSLKTSKDSIVTKYKDQLSRVAAIYGANASGKSNFLKAIDTMSEMVRGSGVQYGHQQFRLSRKDFDKDSEYRTTFIAQDSKKYIYEYHSGRHGITYEELSVYDSQKPALLFRRERGRGSNDNFTFGDKFTSASTKNMITVEAKPRPTSLVLSMLREWNEKVTQPVYDYLANRIHHMEAYAYREKYKEAKRRIRDDKDFGGYINQSLSAIDLGISGVSVMEPSDEFVEHIMGTFKENNEHIKRSEVVDTLTRVRFKHFGDDSNMPLFGEMEESSGTIAALVFLSLFYDALRDGSVCLIDELESSLHPILVAKLIEVFNDKRTNPKGAQLIFTTHDISLIENYSDGEILDRDQIWFAEKNRQGESELYPLTSVQELPRDGANIGMKYIHGRYGATPDISLFDAILGAKKV